MDTLSIIIIVMGIIVSCFVTINFFIENTGKNKDKK